MDTKQLQADIDFLRSLPPDHEFFNPNYFDGKFVSTYCLIIHYIIYFSSITNLDHMAKLDELSQKKEKAKKRKFTYKRKEAPQTSTNNKFVPCVPKLKIVLDKDSKKLRKLFTIKTVYLSH